MFSVGKNSRINIDPISESAAVDNPNQGQSHRFKFFVVVPLHRAIESPIMNGGCPSFPLMQASSTGSGKSNVIHIEPMDFETPLWQISRTLMKQEIKSLRGPKQQPKGTIVEISIELTTIKCADKEFLGNGGNCGSCRLSAMGETLKWNIHSEYTMSKGERT